MKKEVLRQCIATRTMYPKESLIRVVVFNGNVIIDYSQKADGRGAYISKTKEALTLVKKKNLLNRALKTNVPSSIIEELERTING